jgi:hypothetical protein
MISVAFQSLQPMRLSPLTAYYIRKLLRQRCKTLKFVAVPGSALQAEPMSDLDQVIESLYLQESEISAVVRELETLANSHRFLTSQSSLYAKDVEKLESQIFWLLGFKQV